jgi:multicomponent Na+:H+ antiporter subunit F
MNDALENGLGMLDDAAAGLDALGETVLEGAIALGFLMLSAGLVLASIRLFRGPSLADRVVALELVASLFVGIVVIAAISSGASVYLDVAIALTLVAFLGAVVLARYLERRVGR